MTQGNPVWKSTKRRLTTYALVVFAVAVLFASVNVAESYGQGVAVDFYQSELGSTNQTDVLLMKNYVRGALDGIQFANVMLISSNQAPLFCPPENLGLGTNNAIQIIDYEIKGLTDKKKANITVLLLMGLQRAFPCTK